MIEKRIFDSGGLNEPGKLEREILVLLRSNTEYAYCPLDFHVKFRANYDVLYQALSKVAERDDVQRKEIRVEGNLETYFIYEKSNKG